MESWIFLLVGGLGAVGAAMSLGTLAALVRYRSTGELPGQADEQADAGPHDAQDARRGSARQERQDRPQQRTEQPVNVEAAVQRRLLVRIVLGAVVAVACIVSLADQGLLAGPF